MGKIKLNLYIYVQKKDASAFRRGETILYWKYSVRQDLLHNLAAIKSRSAICRFRATLTHSISLYPSLSTSYMTNIASFPEEVITDLSELDTKKVYCFSGIPPFSKLVLPNLVNCFVFAIIFILFLPTGNVPSQPSNNRPSFQSLFLSEFYNLSTPERFGNASKILILSLVISMTYVSGAPLVFFLFFLTFGLLFFDISAKPLLWLQIYRKLSLQSEFWNKILITIYFNISVSIIHTDFFSCRSTAAVADDHFFLLFI